MSYPDPATTPWVPLAGAGGFPQRVKATRATNFTVSNSAWTLVLWDAEDFDTDNMHDLAANTNRLTAKTAGVYIVHFHAWFNIQTLGTIAGAMMQVNSDTLNSNVIYSASHPQLSGISMGFSGLTTVTLGVNDWVNLWLYQNGTGSCFLPTTNPKISCFGTWRIG